MIESSNRFD